MVYPSLEPSVSLPAPHDDSSLIVNNKDSNVVALERVPGKMLNTEQESDWVRIRSQSKFSCSPYFDPGFTKAVSRIRDDVQIAFLKNANGKRIGVFPFQQSSPDMIEPVGGRMNDYHSVIKSDAVNVEIDWLLANLGASRMRFHAWNELNNDISPYCYEILNSHYVDISQGVETYMNWLVKNSSTVKRLPQKIRALSRDFGSARFEFFNRDEQVLDRLIELKQDKFRRTKTFDIFAVDWVIKLLKEIFRCQEKSFQSVLSVLWAGDEVAAAHFGVMNENILHYWFPVYDSRFSKYSPGLQLMLQTCFEAAEQGIDKIDMGYGDSEFKGKFCNASSEVGFGCVNFNQMQFQLARSRYKFRQKLKGLPFKEPLKLVLRKCFPDYGKWHFK